MKKVDFKKSLVRNTEQPISKVKETKVAKQKIKTDTKLESKKSIPSHTCTLDKPELQSTNRLIKLIDDVTKLTKAKGITENEKLAVDEKVLKYFFGNHLQSGHHSDYDTIMQTFFDDLSENLFGRA